METPNFQDYDMVLINTSGGKDSQAMTDYVVKAADAQGYPRDRLVLAHADLGRIEWGGTLKVVKSHAKHYGLRLVVEKRPQGDLLEHFKARWKDLQGQAAAIEDTLQDTYDHEDWDHMWAITMTRLRRRNEKAADRVIKAQKKKAGEDWEEGDSLPELSDGDLGKIARDLRGTPPWSSPTNRFCTSDHKRGQVGRAITQLSEELREQLPKKEQNRKIRIIQCFGFRAEESPARAKRLPWSQDNRASTKTTRDVYAWLPIHTWPEDEVWLQIDEAGTDIHWAYDRGMSRLSCRFCIFAPRNQLMIAAIQPENKELFAEYVAFEKECGFTFTQSISLEEIQKAIEQGKQPTYNDIGLWDM